LTKELDSLLAIKGWTEQHFRFG